MFDILKRFFKRLPFMFAYGLKGGDDIISPSSYGEKMSIIQQEESKNLGEALLKGEVTQEVQDLRYSNYKVSRESQDYKYIGGGYAEKDKKVKHGEKYKFTQSNRLQVEGVLHELNRVGQYGSVEKYTFDIVYDCIPRIKIEPYASLGKFKVEPFKIEIMFFIPLTVKNKYDTVSYMILKELDKISKFTTKYQYETNELCSSVKMLSFTTYKAQGETDMVQYIINDMEFLSCVKTDEGYELSYVSENFKVTDLMDMFYSENQEQKYQNKDSKTIMLFDVDRKEYCDICHKEIDKYDADITRATYGKAFCIECLKKHLEENP